MEKTDRSLVEAHCRGDREAFGELVRRYGDSMLRFLTKMSGNREEAEDLFQETFKRVYEKAHTFRGDRFRSWLFKIAARLAIDGVRRRRRLRVLRLGERFDCAERSSEGLVAVAGDCCEPSEEAVKSEQAEQMRQLIGRLPEKQRATLVLAYYQQLSYREVAEVMGCSIGTVKTQMYRALRRLAEGLPDVAGEI